MRLLQTLSWICIGGATGLAGAAAVATGTSQVPRWSGLGLVAAMALLMFAQVSLRKRYLARLMEGSSLLSHKELRVLPVGLYFRDSDSEIALPWSGIRAVEMVAGQVLVFADEFAFQSISASAFSAPEEAARFAGELRAMLSPPAPPLPSPPPAVHAPRAPEAQGSVAAALADGARLAVFVPPARRREEASWTALVALIALSVAIPLIGQILSTPHGIPYLDGLPEALFVVPLMLFAAWALAAGFKQPRQTLPLLVAFVGLSIPIQLFELVMARNAMYPRWLSTLWLVLAAAVAAIRLLDLRGGNRLVALLAGFVLLGLPAAFVDHSPMLWIPAHPEHSDTADRYQALTNETAFYRQPKLLESALASLQPGTPGKPALYFVGVAPYAAQDVFMKEVSGARKLFDERFGTAGRSMLLVNNAATAGELPLASATSLRAALGRVSEVMVRDQDVLFLFVSSHGSAQDGVALEFWPMKFDSLSPARLKQLLDESGIRRRVVVISACYSGAYVDALKNDDTLVISASAADRQSFGCGADSDLTYFGRAYFAEALRKTTSFSEAFALAVPVIEEREAKLGQDRSRPQLSEGKSIKPILDELAKGFAAR
jgi:hypothetical protein